MILQLQKSEAFIHDFALQALWYVREAGDDIARKFQTAVDARLHPSRAQPGLGQLRRFKHPKLHGLRSFPVARPFQNILLFYRINGPNLEAVRLMHGARDLPRRLVD